MIEVPRQRLTREQSQEQTRQRLIEAARQEVALKGFTAASVRDIAEAAGYSQGAFYSNFKSKESLLLDVLEQHKAEEAGRIEASLDAAGDNFDAAMAALEQWAEEFSAGLQHALLATELQLHASRNPEFGAAYEKLMDTQRKTYAGLISRLFQLHGTPPPMPPEVLANGLMAIVRGLVIEGGSGGGHKTGHTLMAFIRALLQKPGGNA